LRKERKGKIKEEEEEEEERNERWRRKENLLPAGNVRRFVL
jgi:hypothetical protein